MSETSKAPRALTWFFPLAIVGLVLLAMARVHAQPQATFCLHIPYSGQSTVDKGLDTIDKYLCSAEQVVAQSTIFPSPQVTGTAAETTVTTKPYKAVLQPDQTYRVTSSGVQGSNADIDTIKWRFYFDTTQFCSVQFTTLGVGGSSNNYALQATILFRDGRATCGGIAVTQDHSTVGQSAYVVSGGVINLPASVPISSVKSTVQISTSSGNDFFLEDFLIVERIH